MEKYKIERRVNEVLQELLSLSDLNFLQALAEVQRLRNALPDPEKLELLADWFDRQDRPRWIGTNIQDDLRRWAKQAREAKSGGTR